jgi:hypothetical protein
MKNLIKEAREMCEKATPGPWMRSKFGLNILTHDSEISTATQKYTGDSACVADQMVILDANAAFIARSRTLVPELCDALEKAEVNLDVVWGMYKFVDCELKKMRERLNATENDPINANMNLEHMMQRVEAGRPRRKENSHDED